MAASNIRSYTSIKALVNKEERLITKAAEYKGPNTSIKIRCKWCRGNYKQTAQDYKDGLRHACSQNEDIPEPDEQPIGEGIQDDSDTSAKTSVNTNPELDIYNRPPTPPPDLPELTAKPEIDPDLKGGNILDIVCGAIAGKK